MIDIKAILLTLSPSASSGQACRRVSGFDKLNLTLIYDDEQIFSELMA